VTEIEYDNEKEYNNVINKLEPLIDFAMSKNDMESLNDSAIVSIAISLKRIADALTEAPVPRQFDVAPSIFNQS